MTDTAIARAEFANVTLEQPIVRGETTIESIKLRRPRAGELRNLKLRDVIESDMDSLAKLLPRITMPPLIAEEIEQLDPADLAACAVEVSTFFMTREMLAASPTT